MKEACFGALSECKLELQDKIDRLEKKAESDSLDANKRKLLLDGRVSLDRIYLQEETYWYQRSRCKWVQEGDQNTSYFHQCASARMRKNILDRLVVEGREIKEANGIRDAFDTHFRKLFGKRNGER